MPYSLMPIPETERRGPAGVKRILMTPGKSVYGLSFDSLEKVDTVQLRSGSAWQAIEFAHDVAFFSQSATRQSGHIRVRQSVTFQHRGVENVVTRTLRRLAESCNLHLIVELNNGQAFYMGISFFPDRGMAWQTENSTFSDGTATVEAVGGTIKTVTTLSCLAINYAPEVALDLSVLEIDDPPPPPPIDDTTPPDAILFFPLDNATGVPVNVQPFTLFNESIKDQGLAGRLRVYEYATDTLVATFTMGTDLDLLVPDGLGAAPDTLQAGSALSLAYSTQYYILVEDTAVEDLAGNDWPGIPVDKDAWNFTTEAQPDNTPPSLVSLTPPDDATGVAVAGLQAVLEFSEDMQAGIGNFVLYDYTTDAVVASYDVSGTKVTFSGTDVTIDISGDVAANGSYYILASQNVAEDLAGNGWPGFSDKDDWNFTTEDTTAPSATTLVPAHLDFSVGRSTEIYMEFDEPVFLGTGTIKLVEVVDLSGPTDEAGNDIILKSWDVSTGTDLLLSAGNQKLEFLNFGSPLDYEKSYYMVLPSGVLEDGGGNALPDYHVTGTPTASWFWQIDSLLSLSFSPGTGSTVDCAFTPSFNDGFGARSMAYRPGWIKVYDYATDQLLHWYEFPADGSTGSYNQFAPQRSYDVASQEVYLYHTPVPDGGHVYILMEPGMVYDALHGVDLQVPASKNDWHFTMENNAGTPIMAGQSPASGGTFVVLDGDYVELRITWSELVYRNDYRTRLENKYIKIYDFDTEELLVKMTVGDARQLHHDESKNKTGPAAEWRIILPADTLDSTSRYDIQIDQGAFITPCGNQSVAVTAGQWTVEGDSYDPAAINAFNNDFNNDFN